MRTHYINELEAVRQNLVEMGQTAISLLAEMEHVLADPNPGPPARASELEAQTDHQHRLIHDQCLNLIALQAPVAGDARLLTGILDAIVDLELIGDYAYEIVALTSQLDQKPPSPTSDHIGEAAGKVREVLSVAIEAWRNKDRAQALSVRPLVAPIRAECENLYSTFSQFVSTAEGGTSYVELMLISKHLERILRHAECVADAATDAVGGTA